MEVYRWGDDQTLNNNDETKQDINSNTHKAGKCTKKENERSVEFIEYRKKELKGLLNKRNFCINEQNKSTPRNAYLWISLYRRVEVSRKRAQEKEQACLSKLQRRGSTHIATKAPTIKRSTQRLVMTLTESMNTMKKFTRDVTQVYVQSRSNLEREVYILPPKELGLAPKTVLKVA